MARIAKKTNPKLWEQAKREALAKAGKHSARAMMQAVQIYKKKGGGYAGPKTGKEGITDGTGATGLSYGGGGGGNWRDNSQAAVAGNDGAPGIVLITEFLAL